MSGQVLLIAALAGAAWLGGHAVVRGAKWTGRQAGCVVRTGKPCSKPRRRLVPSDAVHDGSVVTKEMRKTSSTSESNWVLGSH